MNWQSLLNFRKIRIFLNQGFVLFWKKNPALWVSLAITLGFFTQFETPLSLIPFFLLFIYLPFKEKIISILLFGIALFWAHSYALPNGEFYGTGTFSISSYAPAKYGGFLYKGTIHAFTDQKNIHLPCRVFSRTLYHPNYEYLINGVLHKKSDRSFVTLKSDKPWTSTKKITNLIKPRTFMKTKVVQFLNEHLQEPTVASFLSALVTGETQDDIQRHVFSKLGLAHLFAVSGFHFALFGMAFHVFLRLFLPKKAQAISMLVILSFFFLFLGNCPSVARAWFMAAFAMIAILAEKEKQSLNTFGLALLFVILMNPYTVKDLSFQLSFLATVGILLFYSPLDTLLQYLFPKKSPHDTLQESLWKQYLYIVSTWFRKALALNFAVHVVLFPVQLSVFSQFPWHSITYNLFFPFLVSISLFLTLISTSLYFVCFWKGGFFLTNWYTKTILWMTEYPPFPQKTSYVENLFTGFTPIALTLIFFIGILFRSYIEKKRHLGDFNLLL